MATLALLRLSAEFPKIFQRSFIAMFIVDKEHIIVDANDMFCKIFGYAYDEVMHQPVSMLHLSSSTYQQFKESAYHDIEQYETTLLVYEFKHKNGTSLWLRISGDLIPDTGEITWTLTDITEQKENEQKIRQLNESLHIEVQQQLEILREKDKQLQYQSRLAQMGEMIGHIAHQWRQPLAAISATTGFLSAKLMLDQFETKEFYEEIGRIEKYAAHLSQTINDFRNFFKLTKHKEKTTLEAIIEETLGIVKPLLINKNITVLSLYECHKELLTFRGELGHVVLNILKNAEDALLDNHIENPIITVRTFCDTKSVHLSIEDNGGGIEESIITKIFNPYFSTKSHKEGTGVGLSMSKTIVEEHCQGKLTLFNTEKGVCFTISLPM